MGEAVSKAMIRDTDFPFNDFNLWVTTQSVNCESAESVTMHIKNKTENANTFLHHGSGEGNGTHSSTLAWKILWT